MIFQALIAAGMPSINKYITDWFKFNSETVLPKACQCMHMNDVKQKICISFAQVYALYGLAAPALPAVQAAAEFACCQIIDAVLKLNMILVCFRSTGRRRRRAWRSCRIYGMQCSSWRSCPKTTFDQAGLSAR